MSQPFKINWRNRLDTLEPVAIIGFDETAKRLKEKLLSFDDEKLSSMQGVFAESLLFATGQTADLPWVDGVIYLGKDARAASIFLPTNLRPNVPLDLFEKSLLRRFSAQKPFAVLENRIIPVGKMRPISRKILSEIL